MERYSMEPMHDNACGDINAALLGEQSGVDTYIGETNRTPKQPDAKHWMYGGALELASIALLM